MNELVEADRGVLVPFHHSEPRHLGTNFHVDQDGLAASINRLLETPTGELAATGALARQWFDDNDRAFRQRFHQLTAELLSAS